MVQSLSNAMMWTISADAPKGGAKRLKASLIASMIVYSHAKPQRAQRKIETFILRKILSNCALAVLGDLGVLARG